MSESRSADAPNDAEPKKRTRRAKVASQATENPVESGEVDDVKKERGRKGRAKKDAADAALTENDLEKDVEKKDAEKKAKRTVKRAAKKASEAEEPVVVSKDDFYERLDDEPRRNDVIGDSSFAEYPASMRPDRETDSSRFFFSGDYMFDDGIDLDNDDFDDDFDEDFEQLSDDEFNVPFDGEDETDESDDESEVYLPVDDEFDDLNSDENIYDSDD